jgi:hypothetical protein
MRTVIDSDTLLARSAVEVLLEYYVWWPRSVKRSG